MIVEKIRKKIFSKSVTHFLLPIEEAEAYYTYLESLRGDQINPFKMLVMETHWDSRKSYTPCSDSQIKLFMNEFHLVRYFRQNFAYLDLSKDLPSYFTDLGRIEF